MRRFIITTILAMAGYGIEVHAQPAIDQVKFTDDGHLEIFGKNFGTKAQVKPLAWLDFEGGSPSVLSRFSSSNKVNGNVVTDPVNAPNKVLLFDGKSKGSGGPEAVDINSDRIYMNLRRYYGFQIINPTLTASSGGLNLKTIRMWASIDSQNNNNIYLNYQGKEGLDSGRIVAEYTDDKTNWLGSKTPHIGQKWISEELIYKTSDIDQFNGVFQYIVNGNLAKSEGERMRTSAKPLRYTKLYLDQISNYTLTHSLPIYYDDIYIDDSYSRVVLTDGSSASTYTRAIPQIPVVWRDDYIKVKLNTARSNKEVYIYVFNSDNQSNKTGVRSCPLCPKPPSS